MNPHADMNRTTPRPVVSSQGTLGRNGRFKRLRGCWGDKKESVSGIVDLGTAGFFDCFADQPVVLFQDLGIGISEALEQASRTLAIGKKEGVSTRWRLNHLPPLPPPRTIQAS